MPKIRGVKPELWTDEDFVELSPFARLLWVGMWNHACDNGHLQDKTKQIKLRVLPTDDVNCAELLREIEAQGLIQRANGWITIPNLSHHQKPHKRWWSTCDKPGCVVPDGASHAPNNRGATVSNGGATVDHGCATADVDCEVDVDGDGESDSASSTEPSTSADDAAAPPARKPRKKPATRLAADWRPTDDHLERCRTAGLDPSLELAKFRAHAEANDRTQVNWNAAFTQWLLNARPSNVRHLPTPQPDEQGRILLPPLPKGVFEQ